MNAYNYDDPLAEREMMRQQENIEEAAMTEEMEYFEKQIALQQEGQPDWDLLSGTDPAEFVNDWDPENDRFSKTLNALIELLGGFGAEWEDLAAYHAPSECGKDVARSQERRIRGVVTEQWGGTLKGFYAEFEARVNPEWAYVNGLPGYWVDPDGGISFNC